MQKFIVMFCCISLLVLPGTATAKKKTKAASKKKKVTICHKGKNTITVSESAVPAHLKHGDTLGECPEPTQPPEQPATIYVYLYYPTAVVYYDAERTLYFFQVDGEWQMSGVLPPTIILDEEQAIHLQLTVDRPYVLHQYVVELYPPGQELHMYHYRYYPAAVVYYDTARTLYFFQVDGEWQFSGTLPSTIILDEGDAIDLEIPFDLPYIQHQIIIALFLSDYPIEPLDDDDDADDADDADDNNDETEPGTKKVTICHKGKNSITISTSAVPAHLAHGDLIGACADPIYSYLYYPTVVVYYDVERSLYFFLVDGEWQSSETLPPAIILDEQEAIHIELHLEIPYTHHQIIIEQYL